MDYISALDANGNVQKLAAQVVDTDKKSSIVTIDNQLEQPLTNQELINAINSGLLNQEIIDAIRYGLATEATLTNFIQSLTVTGDGLLVKFADQNYYPEIQSVDAIDLDIRDLSFTSDKVDVSGSNIVVTNDSNNPIPISDNGQSITVDGEVTANTGLDQPVTNQQLVNAINSGLLNQEIIDAIRYGLATELTLSNFVESLTVTNDGLLVKFVKQNLEFTSDKVDVSGSNIVVSNDSNSPIPISDNGQSITVDGEVELGSTTLAALENITVEINNDTGNPIPVSLQDVSTATKQEEIKGLIGTIAETPPSTDTVSSGLNGRLQRIAQRITSLIALLPSSLGAKTKDLSFPVTLSTDGVASGIAGQIGEVQNNPTSYTVLDRLKAILTALGNVTLSAEAGYLTYRNTALSNTAQSVKNTGGSVGGWNFINVNTTPVYVKFFNLSSVTVGTSPIALTIMVPPGDGTTPGMFFLKPDIVPVEVFSTAISIACVTGLADNSTTAPSTAIHASVRYK